MSSFTERSALKSVEARSEGEYSEAFGSTIRRRILRWLLSSTKTVTVPSPLFGA